ncbi:Beta,beta-carotene 9',10'-oxygenase, partial [Ataeniobius toweri]|nr:Beta,beta-carotene 9',10'-oxygenase [Ataeniobius toweri]
MELGFSEILTLLFFISTVLVPSREQCPQANGLESVAPLVHSGEETPDPIPTTIKGSIPAWINGSFLRNGPGKFEFGEDRYNHWFDGMALMHRFHIFEGSVSYSSRFLHSDSYILNSEKNRIVVSEFGTVAMPDPCKNFFARFFSRFQIPRMCYFFIYCIILFETCSTYSDHTCIIP